MTGAPLKGLGWVLKKPLAYFAVRSRSPKGKVTRVEIHLECGHVEQIKLSRIKHERYRCSECSEKAARDRATSEKSRFTAH